MNELRTTLDMGRETYVSLKCKQNDDRTLVLTLLSNGVTWIPEVGSILELRGKRSDNTVTIQTTTGITIVNNEVTIDLNKDFTRVQGTVELELNIRKLTEITTFTFTLVIEPSVMQDGAMVSKNTSSLLEELTDITDWGHMHLNNAINNIVTLTKKHGQYSTKLIGNTCIVLPTTEEGEYVDIDYMFYADVALTILFKEDNINLSSYPTIQAGKNYTFNFKYIEGEWWCTWYESKKYGRNYVIQKNIAKGYYVNENTGALLIDTDGWHNTTAFMPIISSLNYTMSGNPLYIVRYVFYDINKVYIVGVRIPGTTISKTVTPPPNAKYIRFSADVYHGGASTAWKLEKGNYATSWSPAIEDFI